MNSTRRNFLKLVGAAAVAPAFVPARLLGANAPSNKITLGFIGMGGQGTHNNLKTFLGLEDAHVLAVCDAYMSRAEAARQMVNEAYGNNDCKAVQDFRTIIADPSIDAVVISTPDHWHVPMSLMALEAGKDVFCEKPTLTINEGRELADAFAKKDKIFQAGIEDRSTIHFHKMVEWVKNGAIGKLERVNVIMPKGRNIPLEEPAEPPADLDWNLWQGPAPFHPFTISRTKAMTWRNIDMYSKGAILDIGAHLVDTAQLGVNDPDVCPVEVSGTGLIPEGRMTDVPIEYDLTYRYGNGVEMSLKNGEGVVWDPESCLLEFIGDKGWVRRKTWEGALEASDPKILQTRYEPGASKHWPLPKGEQADFLDCLKSGKKTTYPAIDLHHISTTLHMGVICIQLGRKLRWDVKKEEFINDAQANRLCKRPDPRDWEAEA